MYVKAFGPLSSEHPVQPGNSRRPGKIEAMSFLEKKMGPGTQRTGREGLLWGGGIYCTVLGPGAQGPSTCLGVSGVNFEYLSLDLCSWFWKQVNYRLEAGLERGRGGKEAKEGSELLHSEPSQSLVTQQRNIFQVTASINSCGVSK